MEGLVAVQGAIGIAVLLGAALGWVRPPTLRPYLLLIGSGLIAMVATYPAFIGRALHTSDGSHAVRISHAPGALALSLAFGLRLLVDFGVGNETTRARIARPVALTGMAIGACLDVLVVFMVMFWSD
jgi:hypothetical protein